MLSSYIWKWKYAQELEKKKEELRTKWKTEKEELINFLYKKDWNNKWKKDIKDWANRTTELNELDELDELDDIKTVEKRVKTNKEANKQLDEFWDLL